MGIAIAVLLGVMLSYFLIDIIATVFKIISYLWQQHKNNQQLNHT